MPSRKQDQEKAIRMDDPGSDMITGRSILITGGAGFIGSNIADLLSRNPSNTITILDDFSVGQRANLEWSGKRHNCLVKEIDVCNTPELTKAMAEGVDIVLHHAAIASIQASLCDPIATNRANVQGTLSCLQACRETDVQGFVLASSCAIYGDSGKPPISEDNPIKPISPYAASKAAAENYCRIYHELYGLHTVSLRYFNVYGPRQDPNSQYAAVIPKFIDSMFRSLRPTIYGDGEQTRDFIYVDDVAKANCIAALSKKAGGKSYNVGGGNPTTINRLFQLIRAQIGIDIEPIRGAPKPGDIRQSWADISLIRRELGFEPAYGLQEGLRETISRFKKGK